MGYERLWERLLDVLEGVGEVHARDGRIVVTPAAGCALPPIEIVMTPAEWEDLVTIPFGDFDGAAEYLQARWGALAADQPFLVYSDYALEPSATPELPPDPDDEWMAELLRRHPEGSGRWYARPPERGREGSSPRRDG